MGYDSILHLLAMLSLQREKEGRHLLMQQTCNSDNVEVTVNTSVNNVI